MTKKAIFLFLFLGFNWVSVSFAENSADYSFLISAGITQLNQDDLKSALTNFQKALKENPKGVEALYYIGVTHARAGQFKEAEEMLQKALNEDRSFFSAYFDLGVLYYQTKRDDKAMAAFQTLEKIDPQRARVYYYEGLILKRNGKAEEAGIKLEKAAFLDSELATEADYRAGEAYLEAGKLESARRAFQNIAVLSPGGGVARSAKEYLEKLEKKRWNITLSGGLMYDTNVILEPSQGPVALQTITDKEDFMGVVNLRGRFNWVDSPKWIGRTEYSFYQNIHSRESLKDFNIQDHHLNFQGGQKFGKSELTLQYEVQFTTFGNKNYLLKNSGGTRFLLQESTENLTDFYYWYGNDRYYDMTPLLPNNSDRNDHYHQLGFAHYRILSSGGNLHGGYLFEVSKAGDSPAQDQWSFNGHHPSLGVVLPPWAHIVFAIDLEYVIRQFSAPNLQSPGDKRNDNGPLVTTSFSRSFGQNFDLSLQYLYQKNNSNIPAYDYERMVYGLAGTARF